MDCLLETYIEAFGSARNAIFRLKENWHCMIFLFEDSEKLWKKLIHSPRLILILREVSWV